MLHILKGNIFDSKCQVLVNPVNVMGVMSKGLALQFKQRFPAMFLAYKKVCDENKLKIGKMHIWYGEKIIINFPTKGHWRQPSKMEYITTGLCDLVLVVSQEKITSIGIPGLGCGLGGLPFYLVKEEIKKVHDLYWAKIKVELFEP